MDLDTKLKSIKTQKFARIISFLLALVFVVVGMLNGIEVVKSAYLFGFGDCLSNDLTVYDTNGFENDFRTDVNSVLAWSNRNYMQKQTEKNKTKFVDGMLSKYLETKSYYDANSQSLTKSYNDYYNGDYDGDDGDVDYNEASFLYNIQHKYNEFGKDVFYFQKDYEVKLSTGVYLWFNCSVPLSYSGEQAQNYLEKKFDNEVTEQIGPYLSQTEVSDALQFYIESKDGIVYTNVDDVNTFKKSVTADKGFWLGEDNLGTNKFYSICNGYDDFYIDNTKQAYFQIDMSKAKNDYYSEIQENFDKVNHNPMKNFAVSVACIILLLLLLVWNCILAGRKGSEYKTFKIDKVPNDLHFLVSGGLVAGGFFLLINSLYFYAKSLFSEADIYSTLADMVISVVNLNMFMPLVCALAFAIFLVMSEWLTSVTRQVKAHSGFFKNTLVYMLIKCLVWFFKTVIAKPAKKGIAFLKYRPDVFKKQLMAYLIGYGVVNLLLLFLVSVCDAGMRMVFCLVWFGLNAASLVFVVKYVMDLDEVIKAFNERRPPRVNYQKLPQSLKILVDAQKYTAEELNRAVDKAVRDERMRSELITNVSHDLKTPLTSIITYVDLLKHCDIQDEKAQEYIGVLDEKGGRLKRLIDDLVEASKITSGVVKLNLVQLDLGELATQAVVEHQQEFADNGLELIFKGDKKSLSAIADGQKTYRVIENLMSNARKYSAKGSRVYADVYDQNNTAVFEIKNVSAQPLDISADELKERFVRGDKSRNKEGNGLGLSIADNLCQAMHGRMEITIDGDLFKVKVVLPRQSH